jgi:hypothetical protein
MTINQELSQRMRQTFEGTKSVLTVFFNPKEFAIMDLLPQRISLTAGCFVNNVILPLANRYVQQLGIPTVASYISIIPSATLLSISKNRWPAISGSVFPTPVFT